MKLLREGYHGHRGNYVPKLFEMKALTVVVLFCFVLFVFLFLFLFCFCFVFCFLFFIIECGLSSYQCHSGQVCISDNFVCDGYTQCINMATAENDEYQCGKIPDHLGPCFCFCFFLFSGGVDPSPSRSFDSKRLIFIGL